MKGYKIVWFNFQEDIVVLVRRLNELRWQEFFLHFIKGPPLQLSAGDCAIKLSHEPGLLIHS